MVTLVLTKAGSGDSQLTRHLTLMPVCDAATVPTYLGGGGVPNAGSGSVTDRGYASTMATRIEGDDPRSAFQ